MKLTITEQKLKEIISQTLNDYFKFEDSRLDEIARVGFMEGQRYIIFVRTNDGGFIPHIHIMDQATNGRELDCCVKLEANEYFSHGKHQDILNSKLSKTLNDFMHQSCRSPKYSNNYEFAIEMWNMNNSETYIMPKYDNNGDIIIPDYSHIY